MKKALDYVSDYQLESFRCHGNKGRSW